MLNFFKQFFNIRLKFFRNMSCIQWDFVKGSHRCSDYRKALSKCTPAINNFSLPYYWTRHIHICTIKLFGTSIKWYQQFSNKCFHGNIPQISFILVFRDYLILSVWLNTSMLVNNSTVLNFCLKLEYCSINNMNKIIYVFILFTISYFLCFICF